MDNFEKIWEQAATARNGEAVSPELRSLLKEFYELITKKPHNLHEIKLSLERLLLFLTTVNGRTSANCFTADLFVTLTDEYLEQETFPKELADILGDIGGTLHDTVDNPEIAKNFYSLPEQLLKRVQKWKPN